MAAQNHAWQCDAVKRYANIEVDVPTSLSTSLLTFKPKRYRIEIDKLEMAVLYSNTFSLLQLAKMCVLSCQ